MKTKMKAWTKPPIWVRKISPKTAFPPSVESPSSSTRVSLILNSCHNGINLPQHGGIPPIDIQSPNLKGLGRKKWTTPKYSTPNFPAPKQTKLVLSGKGFDLQYLKLSYGMLKKNLVQQHMIKNFLMNNQGALNVEKVLELDGQTMKRCS